MEEINQNMMNCETEDAMSQNQYEKSEQLLREVKECVNCFDETGLRSLILEQNLCDHDIIWDLASEIITVISAETSDKQPGFFEVCEDCLNHLIECGNAKELLLALLENTDTYEDDIRFKTLLRLIQKTLLRLPHKRYQSLDIALETLIGHIEALHLPEEQNLEGDEKILLEASPDIQRINDILNAFAQFLKPFVWEVSQKNPNNIRIQNMHQIKSLTEYIIKLLANPMVYLELSFNLKENRTKSNSRICAEMLMEYLCELNSNFYNLIATIEEHSNSLSCMKEPRDSKLSEDDVNMEDETPKLGICCFLYLLHSEQLGTCRMPSIYSHQHLFETCLPYVCFLLKQKRSMLVEKGIHLSRSFIEKITVGDLDKSALEIELYFKFLNELIQTMIYCPNKDVRQAAVSVLSGFIRMFGADGKYIIFQNILNTCTHSGVVGYTIGIIKDQIVSALNEAVPNKFFTGNKLWKLIQLSTDLPQGASTDILEHSDRITSALNILRYIFLRDDPKNDVTGIWQNVNSLEEKFFKPLKIGIEMSKAHYELELINVADGKVGYKFEIDFAVGDENVPKIPREQRLAVLRMAVNNFDVIDSLLCRINELVDVRKKTILENK